MTESNDEWKESLKSEKAFHEFIINYFKAHKELTGTYDIPSYYEHYVVRLDNSDGIIISLTTGMNQTSGNAPMTLPTKEKLLSLEAYMRLDGVHIRLYYFIVVVKHRPWFLFWLLEAVQK
ncbi:hypothetical protein, partial [Lentilactobacillus parabuchneri]|uniref:hypothetical protein n=1 Tax=Lentilactobacillus parabuchneri TaxID=152331 RepID=UPI000A0F43A0